MCPVIRPATAADAAGIARVQVTTWRVAYAGLVPAHVLDALSVPAGASRWEGHIADPAAQVWVAEPDGEVAGFASAGPSRDADRPHDGEVYAVYVRPDAQRGGLGRGLLGTALGWLGERGYPRALLWVLTANAPARAFYDACGWHTEGTERGIDVGGAVVDEIRYVTAITSSRAAR